ncbi:hypothetical protein HII36_08765 [Nonomuraea sp. NN258]|uniref:LamG-like jellyroll fold domain-containing protein n=1 Tax=Nonomuraea antri TaxID=2730852 RepID=UPI001569813C|nr:LamG-like jellyroll fold domain-containing protein [Nonomuraea antri]NRQ31930.1 hypothetical protein [Nonomuraea antri]
MTAFAPDRMAARLTAPFQRGADRLPLPFVPDADAFEPYDFAEHAARFGGDPAPAYVIVARREIAEAVTVRITHTGGDVQVAVPAGTPPGTSFMLPGTFAAADRLTSLTMTPAPGGRAGGWWRAHALLGTLARLLWVIGAERDLLRAHLAGVGARTRLEHAAGRTLDLIGHGLSVPRFPPLPYAFEPGTIALYHLDDAVPEDAMPLYGGPGHQPSAVTATPGAVGRFGAGFAFAGGSSITVPDHPAFDVPSLTAECFARPAGVPADHGDLLAKHDGAGWALSYGEFGRGIPRNVRLLLSDGAGPLTLYADQPLEPGRFTHLAAVVDRAAGQARLHVDGTLAAFAPLGALGSITSAAPLIIGGGFTGVLDEVRISGLPRTGFSPVLGEHDDGYRRRLRIFQRWTLPTPAGLRDALNDAVGPIEGIAAPLQVIDANARTVSGGLELTTGDTAAPPPLLIGDLPGGTATPEHGFDLLAGQTLRLTVRPEPPPGARVTWYTVDCGGGHATLVAGDRGPVATLRADRAGAVEVRAVLTPAADASGTRSAPVLDAVRPLAIGLDTLAPGATIRRGGAEDDGFHDPLYLETVTDPRAVFAGGAGSRRMQPQVAARLRRLLDLVSPVRVVAAWRPGGAEPLERAGRVLELEPGQGTTVERLGALAYAAGFAQVTNAGTVIRAACGPGEGLVVRGPSRVEPGESVALEVSPRARPAALALLGATLVTANAGTDSVSFVATGSGRVTGAVKAGVAPVAVAVAGPLVCTADAGGTVTVVDSGAVARTVDLPSAPVDLAARAGAAVVYAALRDGSLAEIDGDAVTRTVPLGDVPTAIDATGTGVWAALASGEIVVLDPGTLDTTASLDLGGPASDVLAVAGRVYAVTVRPVAGLHVIDAATATVTATFTDLGRLPARLAFGGATLYVTDTAGGRLHLREPDGAARASVRLPLDATTWAGGAVAADDERAYVACGDGIAVADGGGVATVWPLGSGHGERLTWTAGPAATLTSTTAPVTRLTATAAVRVLAAYQWPDGVPPRTLRVEPVPELAHAVISKDRYDLIMNVLNALHPIGVEVDTGAIREHVAELKDDPLGVFPGYTYPDFRARGPRPRRGAP